MEDEVTLLKEREKPKAQVQVAVHDDAGDFLAQHPHYAGRLFLTSVFLWAVLTGASVLVTALATMYLPPLIAYAVVPCFLSFHLVGHAANATVRDRMKHD